MNFPTYLIQSHDHSHLSYSVPWPFPLILFSPMTFPISLIQFHDFSNLYYSVTWPFPLLFFSPITFPTSLIQSYELYFLSSVQFCISLRRNVNRQRKGPLPFALRSYCAEQVFSVMATVVNRLRIPDHVTRAGILGQVPGDIPIVISENTTSEYLIFVSSTRRGNPLHTAYVTCYNCSTASVEDISIKMSRA